MVVVDTSAWIEWLIGSATARRIEPYLPPPTDWVVPTIVQLELATPDAIVFATAQNQGASLLTCDGHFKGLPAVTLIDKGKS